jgi:hypothetical protein
VLAYEDDLPLDELRVRRRRAPPVADEVEAGLEGRVGEDREQGVAPLVERGVADGRQVDDARRPVDGVDDWHEKRTLQV